MCYSLEEFAQTNTTKPVSSNWLWVNTIPKKADINSKTIPSEKKDSTVINIKFYADKDTLSLGESVFINWDIINNERVTLSFSTSGDKFDVISDAFASKAQHKVSPKNTTYYKVKSGGIEKTLKLYVAAPPKCSIKYFYFEKDEVQFGQSTTLKWSVLNVESVILETSINGINWAVEENVLYGNIGEKVISPKRNIFYRLICDDATIMLTLSVK